MSLRQLAHSQSAMMVFGRVSLGKPGTSSSGGGDTGQQSAGGKSGGASQSSDAGEVAAAAASWARKLNLTHPLTPPTLVILRGPGVTPEVVTVKPGSGRELEKTVNDKGLMWQVGHRSVACQARWWWC